MGFWMMVDEFVTISFKYLLLPLIGIFYLKHREQHALFPRPLPRKPAPSLPSRKEGSSPLPQPLPRLAGRVTLGGQRFVWIWLLPSRRLEPVMMALNELFLQEAYSLQKLCSTLWGCFLASRIDGIWLWTRVWTRRWCSGGLALDRDRVKPVSRPLCL